MPIAWDQARYEESEPDYQQPRDGLDSRFRWQAEQIVADKRLDPLTHQIVCIGDAYGWLSYHLVQMGFQVVTTEVSQHILDTWSQFGAPGITPSPPAQTDSHNTEERARIQEILDGRRRKIQSLTQGLTITCDLLGDYADGELGMLIDFDEYGNPVLHLVTPNPDPPPKWLLDNNWKTIEGWRAALDAAGLAHHDVVSIHLGWYRTTPTGLSVQDIPSTMDAAGNVLFEDNGAVYFIGTAANGDLQAFKAVNPLTEDFVEMDAANRPSPGPHSGPSAVNMFAEIAIGSYTADAQQTGGDAEMDVFNTSIDAWTIKGDTIFSDVETITKGGGIDRRTTGQTYSGAPAAQERVMGTLYSRQALYSREGLNNWPVIYNPNAGQQKNSDVSTLVIGSQNHVHYFFDEEVISPASETVRFRTYDANNNLTGSTATYVQGAGRFIGILRTENFMRGGIEYVRVTGRYQDEALGREDLQTITLVHKDYPLATDYTASRISPDGVAPMQGFGSACSIITADDEIARAVYVNGDGRLVMNQDDGAETWGQDLIELHPGPCTYAVAALRPSTNAIMYVYQVEGEGVLRYGEYPLTAPRQRLDTKQDYADMYDVLGQADVFLREDWWDLYEKRATILRTRLNITAADRVILIGGSIGWTGEALVDQVPGLACAVTDDSAWMQTIYGQPGYETSCPPENENVADYDAKVRICDKYFGGLGPTIVVTEDILNTAHLTADAAKLMENWPGGVIPTMLHIVTTLSTDPAVAAQQQVDNPTYHFHYLDALEGTPNWRTVFDDWGQPDQKIWSADYREAFGVAAKREGS